jgi:hypothetical protein
MRVQVISIQSGSQYTDGERRIELRFAEADSPFRKITLAEGVLGLGNLRLDDALEVTFTPASIIDIDNPLGRVIRHEREAEESLAETEREKAGRHKS